MIRNDIVNKAREFMGTPFHHQGRLKGVGVDCIGLLTGVAEELGIKLVDNTKYTRNPDGKHFMEQMRKNMSEIPVDEAQIGDVIIFWFDRHTKFPQHAGILTDIGIIHTYGDVGKVTENTLTDKWKEQMITAFQFPGVT